MLSHGRNMTSLHEPTQYWSMMVQPVVVFCHSSASGCRVQSNYVTVTFHPMFSSEPVAFQAYPVMFLLMSHVFPVR